MFFGCHPPVFARVARPPPDRTQLSTCPPFSPLASLLRFRDPFSPVYVTLRSLLSVRRTLAGSGRQGDILRLTPMQTHPAIVHYALRPHAVELREVPVPEVGDGDVLLQVGGVSVCGSDVHQAHNTHSWRVNVPVVLGHEFGGTVALTGGGVRNFREGDRVVSETAAQICGECMQCRTGQYNLCPSRLGFGYGLDGAMARWVRVPARCLHRIPDSLPFDLACLAEPHAVAYQAMCINSTIRPGESVVVLGPGPIGLLCARMAALSGADPLIVAGCTADVSRLEAARRLGATHTVNVQTENLEKSFWTSFRRRRRPGV